MSEENMSNSGQIYTLQITGSRNVDQDHSKFVSKTNNRNRDGLTEVIGQFGLYHLMAYLALWLSVIPHAEQMLSNKWLMEQTPYWCARPPGLEFVSIQTWLNMSAPLKNSGEFDLCRQFDVNFDPDNLSRPAEDSKTKDCLIFEYDTSEFQDTAIHRWDLVCSRAHVPRYIQSVFFVGNFVGALAGGYLADNFGRRFCYCLFVTVWILSGLLGYMTIDLYVWILTRFVCGAVSLGYYNAVSVYTTELTSGKWRTLQDYFFGANAWDFGIILLGTLACFYRNMQTLEAIIAFTNLPFLLAWIVLPESPRWLLSKGHKEQAGKIMETICKVNQRPEGKVAEFIKTFEIDEKQQQGTISDLFRTPAVRRNSILMCFCWYSCSMCYFGLLYNTPTFNWSPFLVFVMPAIPSIPSNFLEPHLENILGRKVMLTGFMLGSGTMLYLTLAFPPGHPGIIVCSWVGVILCGVGFRSAFTFTKDLYPTMLRMTALGTASACARLGSIVSPIVAISASYHEHLPVIIYGSLVLSAGFSSIWIWPETKKSSLFYTMEECEEAAKTENEWIRWITSCAHWNIIWPKNKIHPNNA